MAFFTAVCPQVGVVPTTIKLSTSASVTNFFMLFIVFNDLKLTNYAPINHISLEFD